MPTIQYNSPLNESLLSFLVGREQGRDRTQLELAQQRSNAYSNYGNAISGVGQNVAGALNQATVAKYNARVADEAAQRNQQFNLDRLTYSAELDRKNYEQAAQLRADISSEQDSYKRVLTAYYGGTESPIALTPESRTRVKALLSEIDQANTAPELSVDQRELVSREKRRQIAGLENALVPNTPPTYDYGGGKSVQLLEPHEPIPGVFGRIELDSHGKPVFRQYDLPKTGESSTTGSVLKPGLPTVGSVAKEMAGDSGEMPGPKELSERAVAVTHQIQQATDMANQRLQIESRASSPNATPNDRDAAVRLNISDADQIGQELASQRTWWNGGATDKKMAEVQKQRDDAVLKLENPTPDEAAQIIGATARKIDVSPQTLEVVLLNANDNPEDAKRIAALIEKNLNEEQKRAFLRSLAMMRQNANH